MFSVNADIFHQNIYTHVGLVSGELGHPHLWGYYQIFNVGLKLTTVNISGNKNNLQIIVYVY